MENSESDVNTSSQNIALCQIAYVVMKNISPTFCRTKFPQKQNVDLVLAGCVLTNKLFHAQNVQNLRARGTQRRLEFFPFNIVEAVASILQKQFRNLSHGIRVRGRPVSANLDAPKKTKLNDSNIGFSHPHFYKINGNWKIILCQ